MPKRRKRKIKLSSGFGKTFGPTTINRARQLIRKREFSDGAIARLMKRENLPISAPSVGKLRSSMKLPPIPGALKQFNPAVVKRARQLIRKREFSDGAIARLMEGENLPISIPSVGKLRFSMKLPPLPRIQRQLGPAVVNRARQLIAKGGLGNTAIARLMKQEGLSISPPSVGKLRRPAVEKGEKGKGAKAGKLKQVKKRKMPPKFKSQDLGEKLDMIDKVSKARVELEDQLTHIQSEKARRIVLDKLRDINSLLKQLCKNVPEEALKERGIDFGQNKK